MLALLGTQASAAPDFSITGSGRIYPRGGTLDLAAGYNWRMWGQPQMNLEGPQSPWYGYTRAALEVSTAGTYNSSLALIEFFPVSILGVRGGAEIIDNSRDYVDFDCVNLDCRGSRSRHFLEGQMVLGVGPIFVAALGRKQNLTTLEDGSGPFVDISQGLKVPGEGADMWVLRGFAGLSLTDRWSLIYNQSYAEVIEQQPSQITRQYLLNVRYEKGAWSGLIGGGVFRSSLIEEGATAVIRVQWTPQPSMSLF